MKRQRMGINTSTKHTTSKDNFIFPKTSLIRIDETITVFKNINW